MDKPKVKLWANDGPSSHDLQADLTAAGYDVEYIFTAAREPSLCYGGHWTFGFGNIRVALNLL